MTDRQTPLTTEQASAVYDVLVTHAGARTDNPTRTLFLRGQTRQFRSESRFNGDLGPGGKFWRSTGRRPDGSWGEVWIVSGYPEDIDNRADRRSVVTATNAALAQAQARFLTPA